MSRFSKHIISLLAVTFFLSLATPALAASDCDDARCTSGCALPSEAGLMAHVCKECWEMGECSLEDILVVFTNVADEIFGIVGSLALLLFAIGGGYWLFSQGRPDMIKKGKNFMKGAVVGIVIVFSAHLIVLSVYNALYSGELAGSGTLVICDNTEETEGKTCANNSKCHLGLCRSNCETEEPGSRCVVAGSAATLGMACFSVDNSQGLCPDEANQVCCEPAADEEE